MMLCQKVCLSGLAHTTGLALNPKIFIYFDIFLCYSKLNEVFKQPIPYNKRGELVL